jgi:hypothetical protein
MLLRASSEQVDMQIVNGRSEDPDGGVEAGAAIRRFALALIRDEADLVEARTALVAAVGPGPAAHAACVAASFDGINRVANATGIALDPESDAIAADLIGSARARVASQRLSPSALRIRSVSEASPGRDSAHAGRQQQCRARLGHYTHELGRVVAVRPDARQPPSEALAVEEREIEIHHVVTDEEDRRLDVVLAHPRAPDRNADVTGTRAPAAVHVAAAPDVDDVIRQDVGHVAARHAQAREQGVIHDIEEDPADVSDTGRDRRGELNRTVDDTVVEHDRQLDTIPGKGHQRKCHAGRRRAACPQNHREAESPSHR